MKARTSRTLCAVYGVGLALSIISNWVFRQYFAIDVGAMLVFPGNDANCQLGRESVGVHCFGDFSAIRFENLASRPSGAELVYPVASRIARLPFYAIENLFSYRVAIATFLITAAIACVAPLFHALRGQQWQYRVAVSSLLGLTNIGTIAALDRGNLIAFCVPLIYFFWKAEEREKTSLAIFLLCCAVSIKPQLILLSSVFLWKKKYRKMMQSVVVNLSVLLVPFVILDLGHLTSLRAWIREMQRWSGAVSSKDAYPPNIAFNKFAALFGLDTKTLGYAIAALFVLIIAAKSKRSTSISLKYPVVALILVASLSGPITYIYYLVLFIPACAIVLSEVGSEPTQASMRRLPRLSKEVLPPILGLTLLPLAIPNRLTYGASIGGFETFSVWPPVIPALTMIAIASVVVSTLSEERDSRKHRKSIEVH